MIELDICCELLSDRATFRSVAVLYASALVSDCFVDFSRIDSAIIRKWRKSGLSHVRSIALSIIQPSLF